jgi:hypothetical protein
MDSLVTRSEIGNGSQMIVNMPQATASTFIGIPQRPSLKGPYLGGLPSNLRINTKIIGIMYEIYNARVANERTAKKAAVEPRLIRAKIQLKIAIKASAFVGIFSAGWIY